MIDDGKMYLKEFTPISARYRTSIYKNTNRREIVSTVDKYNSKISFCQDVHILPPNRLKRTLSSDRSTFSANFEPLRNLEFIKKTQKNLFKYKSEYKLSSENRINRISNLLGKIFENKIEQIETNYKIKRESSITNLQRTFENLNTEIYFLPVERNLFKNMHKNQVSNFEYLSSYSQKTPTRSIDLVRNRSNSTGEEMKNLLKDLKTDNTENTLYNISRYDLYEKLNSEKGLPPKSSRVRSYSRDVLYENKLTERIDQKNIKFSGELKIIQENSFRESGIQQENKLATNFINCEEEPPKNYSSNMTNEIEKELNSFECPNEKIPASTRKIFQGTQTEQIKEENDIKKECPDKYTPQTLPRASINTSSIQPQIISKPHEVNKLKPREIPIPTYKKPLVKGRKPSIDHHRSTINSLSKNIDLISETKIFENESTANNSKNIYSQPKSCRKKLNKRNNFTLSNSFLENNEEAFLKRVSETITKIENSNETLIIKEESELTNKNCLSLMSDSTNCVFNNLISSVTDSSLTIDNTSSNAHKKENEDYLSEDSLDVNAIPKKKNNDVNQKVYGMYNFNTENNQATCTNKIFEKDQSVNEQNPLEFPDTMREKIIKNLEAFKLSNVEEKLNSLYRNYQDLTTKSPVRYFINFREALLK
jgi:hypothetical protein